MWRGGNGEWTREGKQKGKWATPPETEYVRRRRLFVIKQPALARAR